MVRDKEAMTVGALLSALTDFVNNENVESTCAFLAQEITNKWIELAKTPITSRPHSQSWWNEQCRIPSLLDSLPPPSLLTLCVFPSLPTSPCDLFFS